MPYGDRTGPMGAGPMTGRAAGFCAGYNRPGNMNPNRGFGFRMGRGGGFGGGGGGGGRGWRNQFRATGVPGWARNGGYNSPTIYNPTPYEPEITPEEELKVLKTQSKMLEKDLSDLKKRIEELETAKNE